MAVIIRESWPGGPLRQWSERPNGGWIPCATGGHNGQYVCYVCKEPVMGLYMVENKWLCSNCKPTGRGGAIPQGLRDYQRRVKQGVQQSQK